MPKIVRFHEVGDASVLKPEELPKPQPGEGEVLLKVEAIGLNRAEVMFRSGRCIDTPSFPSILGYEAAGVIESVRSRLSRWPSTVLTASTPFCRRPPFLLIRKIFQRSKGHQSGCNTLPLTASSNTADSRKD